MLQNVANKNQETMLQVRSTPLEYLCWTHKNTQLIETCHTCSLTQQNLRYRKKNIFPYHARPFVDNSKIRMKQCCENECWVCTCTCTRTLSSLSYSQLFVSIHKKWPHIISRSQGIWGNRTSLTINSGHFHQIESLTNSARLRVFHFFLATSFINDRPY